MKEKQHEICSTHFSTSATVGLLAVFSVAAVIHSSLGVMLSSFITEYGLEGESQGYIGSAESIGLILAAGFSALLLRWFPKSRVLFFSVSLMSSVLLLIGSRPPFLILCGSYCLFGISYGTIDALGTSTISDIFAERSGKVMTWCRAIYSIGGMTTPLILSSFLNKGCRWNNVALGAGIYGGLIFVLYLFTTAPELAALSNRRTEKDRLTARSVKAFLDKEKSVPTLFLGFFYCAHQFGLTIWIVRYVSKYMNNSSWSSYVLTGYWIGCLTIRLIAPMFGLRHKLFLQYGNLTAGIMLLVGIASGNGFVMCITVFLAGASEGMTIPMLTDFACSIDRENSSTACSLIVFINSLGGVIVPLIIAKLIAVSGARAGIMVIPVTSFCCAALASVMFRKRRDISG